MSQRPTDAGSELAPTSSGGMNEGMRVLSYLISGVALYGGLGWVGDYFLGTGFLLPLGIVAGAALGVYVIVRRFGRDDHTVPGTDHKTKGMT